MSAKHVTVSERAIAYELGLVERHVAQRQTGEQSARQDKDGNEDYCRVAKSAE